MTQKFIHKGYALAQTEYNCHYMIFAKDGRMVMHVPYSKQITEEQAREFIEGYIMFAGKSDKAGDKLFEDNEGEDI